jgi:hypothetical protein
MNRNNTILLLIAAAVVIIAGVGFLVVSSMAGQHAAPVTQTQTPTNSAGNASTSATTSAATSASTSAGTTTNGTAKGIFQFSAHNTAANVDNPYIQGTTMNYYWSQLEPQQGQYNWQIIDQDMQPWVTNHKKVILRVATSGWTAWDTNAGKATPQWVYDSGVQSVVEIDRSTHPAYWDPKFLAAYDSFIQAFAKRYDGSPNVALVEVGLGDGGETKVDTRRNNPQLLQQWTAIGYSDAVWMNTMQSIIDTYKASFQHTPLAVLPDSSFIGKTKGYSESTVVNYTIQKGLWLQDDGLETGRQLDGTWLTVPRVEEQRVETKQSGDSLADDLNAALNLKANYILIFTDDISNSANQSALQKASDQLMKQA